MLHTYDDKSSPNQHIYYFRSQTGNVINIDAIMARVFIGTLKEVAFDWFRSLPSGSINSLIDLETQLLSRFYEDDTEVFMDKLLSNTLRGFITFLLCAPLVCHCPCCSRLAGIIFSIK